MVRRILEQRDARFVREMRDPELRRARLERIMTMRTRYLIGTWAALAVLLFALAAAGTQPTAQRLQWVVLSFIVEITSLVIVVSLNHEARGIKLAISEADGLEGSG